jgi:heparan-alpha-glucosaminide N-acetyltransferase
VTTGSEWVFILIIAGLDFCLLAALFLLVDVAQLWAGAPFVYAGMNSIVVYFLSESFDSVFPFRVTASSDGDFASHAAQLFSNILAVLCWLAVARWLYLRKIFINL